MAAVSSHLHSCGPTDARGRNADSGPWGSLRALNGAALLKRVIVELKEWLAIPLRAHVGPARLKLGLEGLLAELEDISPRLQRRGSIEAAGRSGPERPFESFRALNGMAQLKYGLERRFAGQFATLRVLNNTAPLKQRRRVVPAGTRSSFRTLNGAAPLKLGGGLLLEGLEGTLRALIGAAPLKHRNVDQVLDVIQGSPRPHRHGPIEAGPGRPGMPRSLRLSAPSSTRPH